MIKLNVWIIALAAELAGLSLHIVNKKPFDIWLVVEICGIVIFGFMFIYELLKSNMKTIKV